MGVSLAARRPCEHLAALPVLRPAQGTRPAEGLRPMKGVRPARGPHPAHVVPGTREANSCRAGAGDDVIDSWGTPKRQNRVLGPITGGTSGTLRWSRYQMGSSLA